MKYPSRILARTLVFTGPVTLTLSIFAPAAFAENPQSPKTEVSSSRDAQGRIQTKVKTSATASDGTVTTNVSTQKVDTNRIGKKRARLSHKVTRDPKGLMNQTTESVESSAEYKPNGTLEKNSTATSVDASGTTHSTSSTTTTATMPGGGSRTVMKDKEVEDPKGLMNRHTVTKTTTVNRGLDGRPTVTQEKSVDGEPVQRTVTEPAVR